jgi:hypothetical protein
VEESASASNKSKEKVFPGSGYANVVNGEMTVDKYRNIEKVKRLDFDHLDMLVSERIGALKLLAQGMTEREVNDDICRDLILPCVYALAQFLESVKIEGDKE